MNRALLALVALGMAVLLVWSGHWLGAEWELRRGRELFAGGNVATAIAAFDTALGMRPDSWRLSPSAASRERRPAEAYGYMALFADRDGRVAEARADYRACVDTGVTEFIEHLWARERLAQIAKESRTAS